MEIKSITITQEVKDNIFVLNYLYKGHDRKMWIPKNDIHQFIVNQRECSLTQATNFFQAMLKYTEDRDQLFKVYLSWFHLN